MKVSDYSVAILAGGLSTRLMPRTEKIPKILLPIAGKPFLYHQIELLKKMGIEKIVFCLGHLGEMVVDEIKKYDYSGLSIDYSFDGSKLLGTGGAIKNAITKLSDSFFVLNGDTYLPIDLKPIIEFFNRCSKKGLLLVYRNENNYDTSNIIFENGNIIKYSKKTEPSMNYVDPGLILFRSEAFKKYSGNCIFDIGDMINDLLFTNNLAGFEIKERFYEIGSFKGLNEFNDILAGHTNII